MEQYHKLIDKLSPTGKCDCSGYPRHDDWCSAYQKKIFIGDILKKICTKDIEENQFYNWQTKSLELIKLWSKCGITKSLQTILKENVEEIKQKHDPQGYYHNYTMIKQLTPQTQELFSFLNNIL